LWMPLYFSPRMSNGRGGTSSRALRSESTWTHFAQTVEDVRASGGILPTSE
jgi:hypothetical protein